MRSKNLFIYLYIESRKHPKFIPLNQSIPLTKFQTINSLFEMQLRIVVEDQCNLGSIPYATSYIPKFGLSNFAQIGSVYLSFHYLK